MQNSLESLLFLYSCKVSLCVVFAKNSILEVLTSGQYLFIQLENDGDNLSHRHLLQDKEE